MITTAILVVAAVAGMGLVTALACTRDDDVDLEEYDDWERLR